MFDAYRFIKRELADALGAMYNMTPGDIRICERGREAAFAPDARLDPPEPALLERAARNCPYVRELVFENGCVCISLSKSFYDLAVERVNGDAPPAPTDSDRLADAALLRLLMLARKDGSGCPDDAEAARLLWLALGIPGFAEAGEERRLCQRVRTVSQLALKLGAGRPIAERDRLYCSMGAAARALARLLALGMSYQEV